MPAKSRGISLIDGQGLSLPTTIFGGVRLRAVAPPGALKRPLTMPAPQLPECVGFLLEATAEPKMAWHSLVSLRITHALDDRGQKLIQPKPYLLERVPDPLFGGEGIGIWTDDTSLGIHDMTEYRHLVAMLGCGQERSQQLSEVAGTVTAQLLANRPLLVVDDVLTTAGKEFSGPSGVALSIHEVKQEGKRLTISLMASNKTGAAWLKQGVLVRTDARGDMIVDPTLGLTSFALNDSTGKELPLVHCEHVRTPNNQGDPCLWAGYELEFLLADAQSQPGTLCYKGMCVVTVDVPFELRDVPLWADPMLPVPGSSANAPVQR
jgi:hypothetical protein